jgi:hypothetical protein
VTVLETTVFYPIELIKVRLQVSPQPQHFAKAFASMAEQLVAELGWRRGLFRGLTFACASSIPVQYAYIFAYNSSLKQLERRYDAAVAGNLQSGSNSSSSGSSSSGYSWTSVVPRALLPAVAGSGAEIAAAALHIPQVSTVLVFFCALGFSLHFFTKPAPYYHSPQDVVLLRVLAGDLLSATNGGAGGSVAVARDVLKREGLKGFYRGTGASLATSLPSGMVWWVTYEAAKARFAKWGGGGGSGEGGPVSAANAAAAFLAGTAAAISTNPLDLCKTRLQTQRFTYGASGVVSLLALAVRHEGVAVLWKGLQGRIVQFAPSGVVQGLTYEMVMHFSTAEP